MKRFLLTIGLAGALLSACTSQKGFAACGFASFVIFITFFFKDKDVTLQCNNSKRQKQTIK